MTRAKSEYEEIREIKVDLDSLKSNVVALTRHLQEDGVQKAKTMTSDLQETALGAAGKIVTEAGREMHEIEKQVTENPGKSMLFAFCTGILASAVLRR